MVLLQRLSCKGETAKVELQSLTCRGLTKSANCKGQAMTKQRLKPQSKPGQSKSQRQLKAKVKSRLKEKVTLKTNQDSNPKVIRLQVKGDNLSFETSKNRKMIPQKYFYEYFEYFCDIFFPPLLLIDTCTMVFSMVFNNIYQIKAGKKTLLQPPEGQI